MEERVMGNEQELMQQLVKAIKEKDLETVKKLAGSCDLKHMVAINSGSITEPNKEGKTYAPIEAAIEEGCPVKYYKVEVPVAFYALEQSTKEIADVLVKNGAATQGIYSGDDGDFKMSYAQLVEFLEVKRKLVEMERKLFPYMGYKFESEADIPESPKTSKLTMMKYKRIQNAYYKLANKYRVEREFYSDKECTQKFEEAASEA